MNTLKDTSTGILRHWTTGIAIIAIMLTGTFASSAERKPLKVIILAGQSNMQEPASWTTLKGLADSPETKVLYDKLVDETGKVRTHKDVYQSMFEMKRISRWKSEPLPPRGGALPDKFGGLELGAKSDDGKKGVKTGGNFGPELGFGVTLYEELQEPILIIKTAWGGKSLYKDFRPPIGEEWQPPKDHPDHPDNAPEPKPVPTSFKLPKDFEPPKFVGRGGNNLQICRGKEVGEIDGIFPIYVTVSYGYEGKIIDKPIEVGDFIIGINGVATQEAGVIQWRKNWFKVAPETDGKTTTTVWRPSKDGKGPGEIITININTSEKGNRDPDDAEEQEKAQKEKWDKIVKEGGEYYHMMIDRIQTVLKDLGTFHPAYDPEQGYEIAGFVWFQGYNDRIAGNVYPNGGKPRGYEQYSWLLAHLIRNVRKELNAPKMPVVIGVFGQGGKLDTPDPFRDAQAAVADMPEFKGTVAAVQTFPFWDEKIVEIQSRLDRAMDYKGDDPNHPLAKLKAEVSAFKEKMGDPEKVEDRKARRQLEAKIRQGITDIVQTPEEREYLRNNVSNAGYHYYGSPKFFVRAGEAFANALGNLLKDK